MEAELNAVSIALGAQRAAGTVDSFTAPPLGWLLAAIAGVPARGSTHARLEIRGSDRGDVWTRSFGRRRQVSRVQLVDDIVEERFGPLTFELIGFRIDGIGVERGHLELRRTRIGRFSLGSGTFSLRSTTWRDDSRLRSHIHAALLGGRLGQLHYAIDLHNEGGIQ